MPDIPGDSASYFSKDTYEAYLSQQTSVYNTRLRGENETIFDAAASPEADFTKLPEGGKIAEAIRNYR